jgi:uncharacterized protein (TIGR02453 family)
MTTGFAGFPKETLKFLRQLKRNNNRPWFLEHKDVYEDKVKAPMFDLVVTLGNAIQNLAPELIVDPKRSIYRIYRDIRFSADKRPYKTHVSAYFAPRGIPKGSGAGLYFHIEPKEVLAAGGVYMPDSAALRAIRQHIAAHSEDLRAILNQKNFKKLFGSLEGERLKRPPLGFPADHPAIDLLRYKQFYVAATDPPALAEGEKLFPRLLTLFAAMIPLVRFLNHPLKPRGLS